MAIRTRTGIIAALTVSLSTAAFAQVLPSVNWERDEAARALASVDSRESLEELQQWVTAGASAELLAGLRFIAQHPDWPAPARERTLLEFTQSLRVLPPGAVAPEVMGFLQAHQPQVLVAHEDHPRAAVPLFNVRAAALGVENTWQRQAAAFVGAALLARDPVLLIEAFESAAHPPVRRGYQDALASATPGQLEAVSFLALAALDETPQLAALAGEAALRSGDVRALEQLLRTGRGAAVTDVLRTSARTLAPEQVRRLMHLAVLESQPEIAAVAIAELGPVLADDQETRDTLFGLLGDPQLGSSAALALAREPSEATLRQLGSLAAAGDGSLASSRARLALNMHRLQTGPGVRE